MADSHAIDADDPLELFDIWFEEAAKTELNDPNAAALATASGDGAPSVRMVLVKRVGNERFCFFTNAESQKGRQLKQNRQVALCLHWKSQRRQVRVEGQVTELPAEAVDTYFHSRSRGSQVGAAVSDQSRVLASREELEAKARDFDAAHPGEIPRPAYWRGFRIEPQRIEFWMDGAFRLHDRFLFTRDGDGWRKVRLYP